VPANLGIPADAQYAMQVLPSTTKARAIEVEMSGTTQHSRRKATRIGIAVAAVALAALAAAPVTASAAYGNWERLTTPNAQPPPGIGRCTMVIPAVHTTVEVQIAYAADFCELLSRALAADVFRSSLIVTPGRLWHFTDATLSCRLRYQQTPDRITIHNSNRACRWFARSAIDWHREAAAE
jgi:hypothetical protein